MSGGRVDQVVEVLELDVEVLELGAELVAGAGGAVVAGELAGAAAVVGVLTVLELDGVAGEVFGVVGALGF